MCKFLLCCRSAGECQTAQRHRDYDLWLVLLLSSSSFFGEKKEDENENEIRDSLTCIHTYIDWSETESRISLSVSLRANQISKKTDFNFTSSFIIIDFVTRKNKKNRSMPKGKQQTNANGERPTKTVRPDRGGRNPSNHSGIDVYFLHD